MSVIDPDIPTPTLAGTEAILTAMLTRNAEQAQEVTVLAATLRVEAFYLQQALKGVRAAMEIADD